MFTPGGQPDRLNRAAYGGSKGGGGGGYTPPAPIVLTDPVTGKSYVQQVDMNGQPFGDSAQDQLNAGIEQRKTEEKTASDTAAAKVEQDKADALNKFGTSKTNAYNDALNSIIHQFQQKGIDANPYLESDIKPLLNRTQNTIRDLDPNPSAAYGADLGTSIINSLTEGKRTGYGDQLNKIFSPSYAETNIPDSLTGQYSDTLLNEQFDPLRAQLTNAQKRGTLTDVGYNAALGTLGQKLSTGRSTIGDLGKTIIGRDRGEVNDYIGNARKDANAASLSTIFDPGTYERGARNLVDTDVANFGGALRNAVGGTKFADISELINAGGAVQGATNPSATNPLGGLGAAIVADDPNLRRGLGNTGAF
jgi:hypothetical protein